MREARMPMNAAQRLLATKYLPMATSRARKLSKKFPHLEMEIHSACGKALCEAAMKFDPYHGVKFSTFALYRIRGSLVDLIRDECKKNEHRPVSLHPLHEDQDKIVCRKQSPVGSKLDGSDYFHNLVKILPPDQLKVIISIYKEGRNQSETARHLGIGKSWVSVLHGEAIDKLRAVARPPDPAQL